MKRWLPRREQLVRQRWLAPLSHHLKDDRLWRVDRASVARAVAVGLFFGLMVPVAQIVFAVACAAWLRCHVAVAAGATLITNPLTFAPLYWLAHRIGSALLGRTNGGAEAEADLLESQAEAAMAADGMLAAAWQAVQTAGAPLLLGLAVMAVCAAALGFALVWLLWRPPHAASATSAPQER
ncbi:DUF2062 domain-containing protein [Azohydromonas aeria]|uniref:DUF2062 domain-containing protein n=1 Tax=Azohydromonas aeria TaxID=2590212 RepID=UPI0012FC4CF6|nr:DUF2062 domain-containing protein [Azohydromonas aeria]